MTRKKMNVLAVGAHFDDIELGCGGTLMGHVEKGDRVFMLVVSDSGYRAPSGETIRSSLAAKAEGEKAARIIGAELIQLPYKTFFIPDDEALTSDILHVIAQNHIDTVYTHWTGDLHRDHRNTARCVLMASKHVGRVVMYQSSWYDSDTPFHPTLFIDISPVMDRKLAAVKAHTSEIERTGPAWTEFIKSRHRLDGLKIGVRYAESFEPVRYAVSI